MTNLQLLKEYVKALPDTVPDGYDFNQEELEAANNLCAFLSDYAYDNEPTIAETMEWLLMEQELGGICLEANSVRLCAFSLHFRTPRKETRE